MHLTREQLGAGIRAAHAKGAKVTAHLCAVSYREAMQLGVDNLEHGFFTASDFVKDREPDRCPAGDAVGRSLLAVSDTDMQALQRELIQARVAITSTLTVFETFAHGRPMAPAGALALLHPTLARAIPAALGGDPARRAESVDATAAARHGLGKAVPRGRRPARCRHRS